MMDLVVDEEPDPILARDRSHLMRTAHEVNDPVELLVRGGADQIAEVRVHFLQGGQKLIPIVRRLRRSGAAFGRAAGVSVVPDFRAEEAFEDENEGELAGRPRLRMRTKIELVLRIRLQKARR